MKKIIILNGSPRKKGNTSALIGAFAEGAKSVGHEVKEFYLYGMNIKGCLGCNACQRNGGVCVQKDGMAEIYDAFADCDIVVFASPIYFWTVTGVMKTAVDRLYAAINKFGHEGFKRSGVLLVTSGGSLKSQPDSLNWYSHFADILGWTDLGRVVGADKAEEAKKLGASIR
ncbi:flavodoxin family protein [bacterium]|nr:flavodoxin family protein [bacterium]